MARQCGARENSGRLKSLNIIEEANMAKKLPPLHPGEVLREEFLKPLDMSPGKLAKACDLPRTRIERIANETVGVTADTALRLARALAVRIEDIVPVQTTDGDSKSL